MSLPLAPALSSPPEVIVVLARSRAAYMPNHIWGMTQFKIQYLGATSWQWGWDGDAVFLTWAD